MEPRSPSEYLNRFTSRFFLNLRSIVDHQRTSVFESRPHQRSHVRTHSIRKHSGRPMANEFFDMEMHEAVSSSGASPNEEGIGHTDIIRLKVLDSEAHQRRR